MACRDILIDPFDKIGHQRFIISQGLIATLFIMAALTNWMAPAIFEHLVGSDT
ncbi:MAG: hypothetical protein NTX35_18075 [Verrucomicrobia bacterium]|nr:hypothetical protein [Verrucomicrobiota bacterium]